MKSLGSFFPGEFAGPTSQNDHISFGQLMFAIAPGNLFDDDPAISALNSAHGVQEENEQTPEGNEFEPSLGKVIVTRRRSMAARAGGGGPAPGADYDFQALAVL